MAETTIYEMEQRGEFPRRFRLTVRCVVRDLEEVVDWRGKNEISRSSKTARFLAQTSNDANIGQYVASSESQVS